MSQIEKLEQRLLSKPKDFTFQEAERLLRFYGFRRDNRGKTSGSGLLRFYGFRRDNRGKTSGSAVRYVKDSVPIGLYLHRPHPGNIMKGYQLDELIDVLKQGGALK